MTLEIKAFFFNAKMDYLPYYKDFTVDVNEHDEISTILPLIKEKNREFSFSKSNPCFRLNSIVLDGTEIISDVVERFGHTITVEPISIYRSTNGLIIDDDNFMKSFELLRSYANREDLEYYKSLYLVHYSSSSFEYDNHYVGDAILVLANKMLAREHQHKKEILDAISTCQSGLWECEYENNTFSSIDYSLEIDNLKQMSGNEPDSKLDYKFNKIFLKKYKESKFSTVVNSAICFYDSTNDRATRETAYAEILAKGGKIVEFAKQSQKAGQELFGTDSRFGALKAGVMLLDAIDSGACVLLVSKNEDAEMFKKYIGLASKELKRNIDIEIITRSELANMQDVAVA